MNRAPGGNQPPLRRSELLARLRLIRTSGIGPITFAELLARFGSGEAALEALPALAERAGRRLAITPGSAADEELAAVEALGGRLIASDRDGYPPWLRHVEDAPPLLTALGEISALSRPAVAVVGSRNASAVGRKLAMTIAGGLGEMGYVIVSGLARGIDSAAHQAALGTGTVAAMAGGVDTIYPPENEGLAKRLLETGALVSEMPLGWEPRARDFPRRNRIVSGLALGVVVVEAAERSGSLITARLASEQGRVVFAVPGSPLDPRAAGTNRLIKNGSHLVETADDVAAVLAPMLGERAPLPNVPSEIGAAGLQQGGATDVAPGQRQRVVEALGPAPTAIDDLIRLTGIGPAAIHMVLLELDLAGKLERHGGGRVSLC